MIPTNRLGIYTYSDWGLYSGLWGIHFYSPYTGKGLTSYHDKKRFDYVGAIYLAFDPKLTSWSLLFQNIVFESIHLSIYKSRLHFGTVDLGKQHIDEFLSKVNKLKAFL